jgi:MFS family permease
LGVGLGISGLLTYNLGLFTTDLQSQIGLTPATYGGVLLGLNVALALAMPLVGRLVDRFGPRAIAATGSAILAGGFLALSRTQSIAFYAAVLVAIGFCASLSAPVAHTRAVAGSFTQRRGLALGITQVGIGLAAALVPPLVAAQISGGGWRSGFVLLAALAVSAMVPILLGLPGRSKREVPTTGPGKSAASLWSSIAFRLQLAAFTSMALAFIGIIAHFVPMLRASGVSLPHAGALAGSIGLSVIVTRLIVGWLADHVQPAWLGAASCLICAAGALGLAVGGPAVAFPAALTLGCAIGAEADLIGILTARNFPLGAYSRSYSMQYAAFTVAGGLSPFFVGMLAETTGSYRVPLLASSALLLVPVALFASLARWKPVSPPA